MNVLVVYDSTYGGTRTVANQVGFALRGTVIRVADATLGLLVKNDLLVVGSPTIAGHPTKAICDFLAGIPGQVARRLRAIAFDTRLPDEFDRTLGYAAAYMNEMLQQKGCLSVAEPEGFLVERVDGVLRHGEISRALAWANEVLRLLQVCESVTW